MAKPSTPLFSLDAHGTVADTLTFQKRSGTNFARTKPIPTDPQTALQLAQRDTYRRSASSWHDLTDAQKQAWNTRARPLRITGFNLYLHYLLQLKNNLSNRWAFLEGSGLLTHDSWGDAAPGTIVGSVFTLSKWGYSLNFDGIDNRVSFVTPDSLKVTSEDFSLIARINCTTFAVNSAIFSNSTFPQGGFRFMSLNNGEILFYKDLAGAGSGAGSGWNVIVPGTWQIVGFTRQGNVVTLYRDGIDVTAWVNMAGDIAFPPGDTFIGAYSHTQDWFNGLIDFVLYFRDIALSPAQMLDWAERTL